MTDTYDAASGKPTQPSSSSSSLALPRDRHVHVPAADETSPLLPSTSRRRRNSRSGGAPPPTPRDPPPLSRSHSHAATLRNLRHHHRNPSFGQRLVHALAVDPHHRRHHGGPHALVPTSATTPAGESKFGTPPAGDDRMWYDQFTSTDWVRDVIADAHRVKALRRRRDFRGRLYAVFDASQGWILSALCGAVIAVLAYCITVTEATLYDWKEGFCVRAWWLSERSCCPDAAACDDWRDWSDLLPALPLAGRDWTEFGLYILFGVLLAVLACLLTLTTQTVVPSAYRLTTLDENLAAPSTLSPASSSGSLTPDSQSRCPTPRRLPEIEYAPPMVYYSAAGSGVAEVRVILSGFVLHGFLGLKTLAVKSAALVLSVASGMSLGKEGPYVHIATCVGNIACRLFDKYDSNDAKRREVLSAAAAAGVAVAFGAPLGGVLFGLEEVSYFFPAKTLFRTFFCCIVAALSLKFLNPYGTHKIVMFQVRYLVDWEFFELAGFVLVGILGGAIGALFIKASKYWATTFRRIGLIKRNPLLEVVLVAVVTGLTSYWNRFTRLPVANLMYSLASACREGNGSDELGICPRTMDGIPPILGSLFVALLIKGFLTVITFGIKVPAGIYVPSMVIGGLMGRIIGHSVQWIVLRFPDLGIWASCAASSPATCIQPGVYGLIAAGSTMCGVTRLSVTLAVILFELTGSLDYVLPFSLAILVAKWTADWIEPNSIYDLLTSMNSYPFLDNKHKPLFTGELADIVSRARHERIIDITRSPAVPASELRVKLELLHRGGELDGGLPIVRDGVLVGLIPAPELAYGLDQIEDEEGAVCLMASVATIEEDGADGESDDPCDFTRYIDPAPVALDIKSPMDLVYECFVKLGLRYICILKDGRYAGMTHKKAFVKYMRELEAREGMAR